MYNSVFFTKIAKYYYYTSFSLDIDMDTIIAFFWNHYRQFELYSNHLHWGVAVSVGIILLAIASVCIISMIKQLAANNDFFADKEEYPIFLPLGFIFGCVAMHFAVFDGPYKPDEGIGICGWIALFFISLTAFQIIYAGINLFFINPVKACVCTVLVLLCYLFAIPLLLPSFFTGFLLFAFCRSFLRMLLPYRVVGYAIDKFDRIWEIWDK